MPEAGLSDWDTLRVVDAADLAPEPGPGDFYKHHARLVPSLRKLWAHREIVFTLAERDFKAQYKQAFLGVLWALLSPVLTLIIMIIVFSRARTFGTEGLPFGLFAFPGILCWSFFSGAVSVGGNSLLTNKALLNKTQFPRESFPLETLVLTAINTVLSWIPLAILFVVYHHTPKFGTLWAPMFMVVEVMFAAGVTLLVSAVVIQMRDLVQVLPIIVSLGLFVEPVVWPLSKIPHQVLPYYDFLNPLGQVIDNVRRTMLLGQPPNWGPLALAALGAVLYLLLGYKTFKRLEVQFADIA